MYEETTSQQQQSFMPVPAERAMGNVQQCMRKLRRAIDENDSSALRLLVHKGVDLNMQIDDCGNTPLTLAVQLNHSSIVQCLVDAKCDIEKKSRQQFSALEVLLLHLAHSENTAYLTILGVLLRGGAESVSEVVVETAFHLLQHNEVMLKDLIETVVDNAPKHHDLLASLSQTIVQYNKVACFRAMLERGVDMHDIWPNTCDKRFFLRLDSEDHVRNDVSMFHAVHCNINPLFARMCIQAANDSSILSGIIYFLLIYPISYLNGDHMMGFLQFLSSAGYKISPFLLSHLNRVNTKAVQWYHDYHSQPKSLAQSSRLCIRQNLRTNVICGVRSLPIPRELKSYLILNDVNALNDLDKPLFDYD